MSSASDDDVMDNPQVVADDDGDDDLFGDEDEAPVEKPRELSDQELDSGDDEERRDRAPRVEAGEVDSDSGRDARVMDISVWRHHVPKPFDGQFDALRLPNFLGIEPRIFDPDTFKPPVSDHHTETKSSNFLASAVSSSTMRYRTNPSTGKLESNANLYKWSDGSTTISIGDKHYELQTKPLVPQDSKNYQEVQDSHQYLATPSIASQLLTMVGHMTNQHIVRPPPDIQDDALERLQKSLAAATRGGNKDDKNGPEIISNTQDPELQKKRAEVAEKERLRAQRRRETAAEKANLPRSSGGRGGLNVDDLEGRSGRRAPGVRRAPKPRGKGRTDYDSEDDLPRGRNRENEYDKDDGFLATSDEDGEEGGEGEDEEEEEEILEEDSDRPRKKQKTTKSKPEETSDADADADLDDDEAPVPAVNEPAHRGRNRHVIEDDDDDE